MAAGKTRRKMLLYCSLLVLSTGPGFSLCGASCSRSIPGLDVDAGQGRSSRNRDTSFN